MDAGERVVLVHDWLTGNARRRSASNHFCRRWPSRLLLIRKRGGVSPVIEQTHISPAR
ncbi:MAG: hypothetical protein U0792_06360 [Gemmataceae bacterium]